MAKRDLQKEQEQRLDHAIKRDPTVIFMLQKMEEAGCTVGRKFFKVEQCDNLEVGGGFSPQGDGVTICCNEEAQLHSQQEVNNAMVHELLHAYDHCRANGLDWSNCDHHACSEVRAANLSGDCTMSQEWARGNYGLKGQHKICIRRRAEISVAMNPNCRGNRARDAVSRVFDTCFKDTAPFDRIP